jgi:hypothetical protein
VRRCRKIAHLFIACCLLLLFSGISSAQEVPSIWPKGQPREAKWRAFNALAAGYNPIIFGDWFKVYRAIPITSGSHFLTRDSMVRYGAATMVSPLIAKAGPFVGISPLLILDLDVYWNQYMEFQKPSFDSIHDDYSPHILARKKKTFDVAQNFVFSSTLKLAYAGVILLNMLDVEYLYMQDIWLPIELYTVVDDGWHYTNRTYMFYEYEPGWRIGSMFETFHVLNSGFNRHIVHLGFMADRKLPLDHSLIFLTGYHVDNPDFFGLRIWTAILKEWDL